MRRNLQFAFLYPPIKPLIASMTSSIIYFYFFFHSCFLSLPVTHNIFLAAIPNSSDETPWGGVASDFTALLRRKIIDHLLLRNPWTTDSLLRGVKCFPDFRGGAHDLTTPIYSLSTLTWQQSPKPDNKTGLLMRIYGEPEVKIRRASCTAAAGVWASKLSMHWSQVDSRVPGELSFPFNFSLIPHQVSLRRAEVTCVNFSWLTNSFTTQKIITV